MSCSYGNCATTCICELEKVIRSTFSPGDFAFSSCRKDAGSRGWYLKLAQKGESYVMLCILLLLCALLEVSPFSAVLQNTDKPSGVSWRAVDSSTWVDILTMIICLHQTTLLSTIFKGGGSFSHVTYSHDLKFHSRTEAKPSLPSFQRIWGDRKFNVVKHFNHLKLKFAHDNYVIMVLTDMLLPRKSLKNFWHLIFIVVYAAFPSFCTHK